MMSKMMPESFTISAKNIDLVVCFMSQDLTDSSEAQAVIAQDSRLIYGYYNE